MKKTAKNTMPKAQLGSIVKGAIKGAKSGYKSAKKAETAHLKRAEDWEKYYASKSDRRLKTALAAPTAIVLGASMLEKYNSQNKKKVAANKVKVKANTEKVEANKAKYKKAYGGATMLKKAQTGGQTVGLKNKKKDNADILKNVGTFLGAGLGAGALALRKDIRAGIERSKARRAEKKELRQEVKLEKKTNKIAKNKK
jgi:hypothetical protein